ncbi:vesicular glutamate transporter 2 [Lingula anatina]|uniref:Vesicular glutamate transporter 2 n=1 Tax=Lingula anatina TaxID=7574 RepID=A0A1S3K1C8_LINAN|nr:vesicular glutamate transporter 2 [Lingula anatina]|eukprot:XP_013416337.1 vesicular glutamate transporter 2 [Lingula anatina]
MPACCGCIPRRYVVAVLGFLGLCISFGLRSVLAVTVTSIVAKNTTRPEESVKCISHQRLAWTTEDVGWVFSAYGYGYIITQIPGGILAAAFPAHRVFAGAHLVTFALFALIPTLMPLHFGYVVAIRVLQGLAEGVIVPSMQGIWSVWAPENEKNRLALFSLSGAYCGPAVAMLLTGIVNCHVGWEYIFYMYSGAGGLWVIVWFVFVFESPHKSPDRLGEKERMLFEKENVGATSGSSKDKVKSIPWKDILTSPAVWAVFVAGTTRSWVLLLVTNYLPEYLDNTFGRSIDLIGLYSALPFFVTTVTVSVGGLLVDTILKKKLIPRTLARKLFNCCGFAAEASILIAMGFVKSEVLAVILFCLSCGFSGIAASGYQANPLDLARDYASILMGISKMGGVGGMVMPTAVARLTKSRAPDDWAHVFWVTATLELAGVVIYAMYASGKQQKWSNFGVKEKEMENRNPEMTSDSSPDVPDPKAST